MPLSHIRQFFLPTMGKGFFVRLAVVTLVGYLVFGHVLIPLRIQGKSMEPTYHDGSFTFCWRLQHLFAQQKRFDVVAVRFSGTGVMLLKRIVALQGETVEFREGFLYVNGTPLEEPYVEHRSDWNLPGRTVGPGHVYVVGDNRGTPMAHHRFGEVSLKRIAGGVIP